MNQSTLRLSPLVWPVMLCLSLFVMTGCDKASVYNPSIADLNTKAQAMLQNGDTKGAVSRLESARDLNPKEPLTMYNLAIAYEQNGDSEKSIALFQEMLDEKIVPPGVNEFGLKKNLSVALESLADMYSVQADEATEKKKLDEASTLRTKAVILLERSKELYALLLSNPGAFPQEKDAMQSHINGLETTIEKLKDPNSQASRQEDEQY